jgi:hypothetical protein
MVLAIHDQEMLERVAGNWRLTPATMATKLTKGKWIAAPWLKYSSLRVAQGIARGGARIIISAPPRHGKSELISVHTSTWVLENFPNKNVILAAYGADLAEGYGRRVRDQIREQSSILKVRIRDDVSKVGAFLTDANGYMYSVGLGGAITGRGAHVLLIDDYIKEIKEALSPAHREYVWQWFVTTAMTRLEPGASVIIIATRWHSDDLIGRILKNFPGQWEYMFLPAIAQENDLLGRPVGAPLFPERFNIDFLREQEELLGKTFFQSLYQQQPIDETNKLTNPAWLNRCSELPGSDFRWARAWDLAATEEGGDFTTGTLGGYSRKTNNFVIANIVRRQLSPAQAEVLVRNTALNDGIETPVCIEQEPGSAGKNLVHHYATNVLPEFRVVPVPATTAKIIRGQPFLAACEAGKVYLLDESVITPERDPNSKGSWIDHFIREFELGYSGAYDDQLDTAAACYNHVAGKKTLSVSWGRTPQKNYKTNSKAIRKASFMVGTTRRVSRVTFGR